MIFSTREKNMKRLFCLIILASALSAYSWYCEGHQVITGIAVDLVKGKLPASFAAQRSLIVHCSCDPDVYKPQWASALRSAEAPEHFIDLEYLDSTALPATRYEFLSLCCRKGLDPSTVGLLPYAVIEWMQRLCVTFAEQRAWPDNKFVQQRSALCAGILSHYVADAGQPLHVTIHFNGRVNPNGSQPAHSGIHGKVDALAAKVKLPADFTMYLVPVAFSDPWKVIVDELKASQKLVERVYALESRIPAEDQEIGSDTAIAQFSRERVGASAIYVADLFLTAWQLSAGQQVPPWHGRPPEK
jgi:hypothetical protein